MKKNLIIVALVVLQFTLGPVPAWPQTVAAQVQGTVTEAGTPIPNAAVVLTNAGTGRSFKVKTDKNGKFSMVGVPYGDYEVEITSSTGEDLFKQKTTVAPDDSSKVVILTIDMGKPKSSSGLGGQAGQATPKMTKEQLEALQKQNEKAANMNALIQQAQNAMNAKNWQEAIPPLQQLLAVDPTRWQFYQALANAQLNLGQYEDAIQNFDKGIQAAESNTAVDPKDPSTDPAKKKAGVAQMLTNEGNAYLKLHKNNEAIAAYNKAASMNPNPATAYFNLCATLYNTGDMDSAIVACDRAIQADPNKVDAYFIKGSAMYGNGKLGADNKYVVPPGTIEALNKYLELGPAGAHAADVKAMLEAIGAKVETTYGRKKK